MGWVIKLGFVIFGVGVSCFWGIVVNKIDGNFIFMVFVFWGSRVGVVCRYCVFWFWGCVGL